MIKNISAQSLSIIIIIRMYPINSFEVFPGKKLFLTDLSCKICVILQELQEILHFLQESIIKNLV